jgi:hypothetical protein
VGFRKEGEVMDEWNCIECDIDLEEYDMYYSPEGGGPYCHTCYENEVDND